MIMPAAPNSRKGLLGYPQGGPEPPSEGPGSAVSGFVPFVEVGGWPGGGWVCPFFPTRSVAKPWRPAPCGAGWGLSWGCTRSPRRRGVATAAWWSTVTVHTLKHHTVGSISAETFRDGAVLGRLTANYARRASLPIAWHAPGAPGAVGAAQRVAAGSVQQCSFTGTFGPVN